MLILERGKNEKIIINGNIEIWYSSINQYNGKIKLAISAPRDVIIDREEIHQRKLEGIPHHVK